MLKKTALIFAFLTVFTAFHGFNADFAAPADAFAMEADDHSLLSEGEYVISAYDNIIRSVSEREGNDWRLLSAIAYHESRFTPDAVSGRGARGLMQIMPVVARQFEVPADAVADPATNVWLANRLLKKIDTTLRFARNVPERDRMSIVLASYNGGIGHVSDARRLAGLYGENPDSWEVVARYLELKADSAYYENEAVKYGKFTGSRQTIAYVRDVMGRYDKYCRIARR